MQPSAHFAAAAVGGGAVWFFTGEPLALPVAVVSGVAIDVDYVMYRFTVAIKLLHGWEWLVALVATGMLTGFPWWITAATLGYGLHVAGDHLSHKSRWWWYFATYRTWRMFRWPKSMVIVAPQDGERLSVSGD